MRKMLAATAAVTALASVGADDILWTFDTSNRPADVKAVVASTPAKAMDSVGFATAVSTPAIAVDAMPKATATSTPEIGIDTTPTGIRIIVR